MQASGLWLGMSQDESDIISPARKRIESVACHVFICPFNSKIPILASQIVLR